MGHTYFASLDEDLPDPKVVQSANVTGTLEEVFEAAFLAEFGLDVEIVVLLPAADIVNNLVTVRENIKNLNLLVSRLAPPGAVDRHPIFLTA